MELIKLFLHTVRNYDGYFIPLENLAKQIQEKTNDTLFSEKFIGHFFLAKDTHLIEDVGVCFYTGPQYNVPAPANRAKLRITSQGIEFLEALKDDTIFNKIKDFSLGVSTEIGKKLLVSVISKAFEID